MKIPKSHPRYESLRQRHNLIRGLRDGYVADAGLIAYGRGEAFDYLIGEKTLKEAEMAEKAAVAMLLLSKNPVISVNGNIAALLPTGIVKLANLLHAGLEVNLFYGTKEREKQIREILKKNGAVDVLGTGEKKRLPEPSSKRGEVDPKGILVSDTVLVPLEDGDRAEALLKLKKNVISIDLNPLSRTSQNATISIVDNVVRAVPNMIGFTREIGDFKSGELKGIVENFDNTENLKKIIGIMRCGGVT